MIDKGDALRKAVLNAARFSGASSLLAPVLAGMGAILMLHRVNRAPAKPLGINRHLTITPDFLDAMLADLAASGHVFVGLDELLDRLARGAGRKFVAVTADDAYRDILTDALPVLERHAVPITVYVAPGLTDGRVDLWWDALEDLVAGRDAIRLETLEGTRTFECATPAAKRMATMRLSDYLTRTVPEDERQAILDRLVSQARSGPLQPAPDAGTSGAPMPGPLMSWDDIRRIAAHPLVTIGAHTVHHYNLRRLDEERALHEMAQAADMIAAETGERPLHMAYPYGYASAVGAREVALAASAGFRSAVTTRHGVLHREHAGHPHALPRISVNGRFQRVSYIRTMLSGVTTAAANAGRRVVTV